VSADGRREMGVRTLLSREARVAIKTRSRVALSPQLTTMLIVQTARDVSVCNLLRKSAHKSFNKKSQKGRSATDTCNA
jgi:hypothetical protein